MEQQLEKVRPRQAVAQGRTVAQRTRARPVLIPTTDIYETRDTLVVLAEMPGVASEGIDITLEDRTLTIRGQTSEQEHPGYRKVYAEYGEADYERTFTMSEEIDRGAIEASLENGVLRAPYARQRTPPGCSSGCCKVLQPPWRQESSISCPGGAEVMLGFKSAV